jgi:hypothetical protein
MRKEIEEHPGLSEERRCLVFSRAAQTDFDGAKSSAFVTPNRSNRKFGFTTSRRRARVAMLDYRLATVCV